MKRSTLIGLLAVLVIIAVAVVVIRPWEQLTDPSPQRTSIRIGTSISETGRLARLADLYTHGRQFAIEKINAAGGVKVGNVSYPIELVQLDDQSDADLSVRLYERLINDEKVDFLLGPYSSGLVIPTSAIAEKYKIPMVQGGGASSNIFNRKFKYVFGTLPAGPTYLEAAVKLFADHGSQTMALIYADDAFSVDVAQGTRSWALEYGLEIVLDEKYTDGQTEFSALIAKLKDANPDVVMSANHLVESIAFVQQARSLGLESDLVFTVGVPTPDFLNLGSVAERVFGVTPWVPTQASSGPIFGSAANYAREFRERFEYEADYHDANGTIEVLTYKYAIEKAGSLDREAVRKALTEIRYDSFYGTIFFDETGQADMNQIVVQIQNGVIVTVGPGGEAAPIFNSGSSIP